MSLNDPIAVAVIDDNRLVREGLAAMLNRLPDMRAAAYPDTGAATAAASTPRVLLLDVGLGDDETIRVVSALATQMPDAKIIVMDLIPVTEEILELVNAGV